MKNEVYQQTASDPAEDEVTIEIKPKTQVPLLWKILLGILIIFIIVLIIGLIVQGKTLSKVKTESKGTNKWSQKSALGNTDSLDHPENPTVFQDLSGKEIISVRDYMLKQKQLDLTPFEKAKLSDNFIVLIEHYLPAKAEVLDHLDNSKGKPPRSARVIISYGKRQIPFIEEYLVEGLPTPTNHKKLIYTKAKDSIPFESRIHTSLDSGFLMGVVNKATGECYQILRESFGYWANNCSDRCLGIAFNGIPATSKAGDRKLWITAFRNVPGLFANPFPFVMRIDIASPNESKWNIDQVMYNFQQFSSISDLVTKYRQGALKKVKIPIPTDEQLLRSTLKRRVSHTGQRVTRGSTFIEPDGRRFLVQGRHVTYKEWSFHFAQRTSGGLALYDVKFGGKRIAYEISLQEGASFYSGYGPQPSTSYFLDNTWGLGWSTYELIKGIDCPETAVYVDAFHFYGTENPQKHFNSICIFELNTGVTGRRHREWKFSKNGMEVEGLWFLDGLVDRAIVIRTVSTPYNYDYTIDYILHENGVIEVRTTPSGYALHTAYSNVEDPYGYRTMSGALGPIHDHFILHKVDLDIAGTANTFQTLDVKLKEVDYKWEKGTKRFMKTIERNIRKREEDAAIKYDFDDPKYYVIMNEGKKNMFNTPKGYRIIPINMVKQLYPEKFFPVPAAAWTKYQLVITKRKDEEPFGTSLFNQFNMKSPVFNFDSMIKDNENLRNEDLVAWITTGGLHIPNTEDVPTTTSQGSSWTFFLKPFGYFDEDPSTKSGESYYETSEA